MATSYLEWQKKFKLQMFYLNFNEWYPIQAKFDCVIPTCLLGYIKEGTNSTLCCVTLDPCELHKYPGPPTTLGKKT
jgi:hypothetical protein